jgi:CheY-like chemotaxis protein
MPGARERTQTNLIVDDDEGTRATLSQLLEEHGYGTAAAADGRAALNYLRHQAEGDRLPCLILLDLVMPVDGWQFRTEQREDPNLARIPVVVMSGVYQPGPAAKNMRAAAYLPKPIDRELLLAVVGRFCSERVESCERG